MARLFQALVVLGGSLAGCGGRTGPEVGRTDNEREETAKDAGTETTTGAVSPTQTTTNTQPTAEATQTESVGPSSSESGRSTSAPTGSIIILDPLPPASANLPDDCPPEQWQCEWTSCASDATPTCGDAWNGDIESCPIPLSGGSCICGTQAPDDCGEGEVRTCLHSERQTPDGRTEMLHFACECLPKQNNCGVVCDQHSSRVGSYQRSCVATPDLVLCGGCIWAGILR